MYISVLLKIFNIVKICELLHILKHLHAYLFVL